MSWELIVRMNTYDFNLIFHLETCLRTNYIGTYVSIYFVLEKKTTSYQKCLERERIRCLSVHKALHKIMHTANHRLRFVFVSP